VKILDWDVVMQNWGHDRPLVQQLVQMFLEEAPTQMTSLREAIARKDSHALWKYAQQLKGEFGSFTSDCPGYLLALRLEQMSCSGDFAGAEQAFPVLERALERFTSALAAFLNRVNEMNANAPPYPGP
jgi:hypothetical protein